MSDVRWELIEPVFTAWRAERRRDALNIGRPPEHDLGEIMNAILYVARTGAQWRYLLHDFPPWETVYGSFAKWQKDGVFVQLSGVLPRLLRQKEDKAAEPSACVITRSLRVVRRQVTDQAAFSPGRLARAIKATHAELLERLLPPRRRRANPRVIKRKVAGWPLKRAAHRVADHPRPPAITIIGATKPKRVKRIPKP